MRANPHLFSFWSFLQQKKEKKRKEKKKEKQRNSQLVSSAFLFGIQIT